MKGWLFFLPPPSLSLSLSHVHTFPPIAHNTKRARTHTQHTHIRTPPRTPPRTPLRKALLKLRTDRNRGLGDWGHEADVGLLPPLYLIHEPTRDEAGALLRNPKKFRVFYDGFDQVRSDEWKRNEWKRLIPVVRVWCGPCYGCTVLCVRLAVRVQ